MLAKDGGEPFACLRFKRKIWADSGAFPSPRVSGSRKLEKEGKKKKHKMALGKSRAEKEVGKQIPRRRKRREMVLFWEVLHLKKSLKTRYLLLNVN